ncbi:MAG: beta strand repeat-containing protein [Cyanobacteriota bacterium]
MLDTTVAVGQTVTITDLIDNVGLITGSVSASGVSNDTSPTLQGTLAVALASDETLQILSGTTVLGNASVASDRTWSYTASLTAGSTYTLSARVIDTAGNTGNNSSTRVFSLDTSAPAQVAPVVNLVDDVAATTGTFNLTTGVTTNDVLPTLTGTLSAAITAGDVVRVYINGAYQNNATLSGTTLGSTWSSTPTLAADGSYTVTTRVMDAAGNESVDSTARIFSLDTTAPGHSVVISSVNDNATPYSGNLANGASSIDTTPTLSAGLAAGEVLRIFPNGTALTGNASVTTSGAVLSWSYTTPVLVTSSANPTYSFTAAVIDAAGNSSTVSDPWTLTLDNTNPAQTITITDVMDGDATDFLGRTGSVTANGFTNDTTPTIVGTLSAALGTGENLLIYRDATATTLLGTASIGTNGVSWSFTPTTALSTNGAYTLSARVVDAAGNLGGNIATRIFSLDTLAPAQTVAITNLVDDLPLITGSITNGGLSNDRSPTLSGTLSVGLGTGENLLIQRNGVEVLRTTFTGTSWSYTSPSLSSDGAYTFTARIVDAAGNSGASIASRSYVLDTTVGVGQTVAITDLVDDLGLITGSITADGFSNDTTPTLYGTLAVGLASDETLQILNGTAVVGTASVASDRTWSFTSPALATSAINPSYTFSARVIDTAGNTGSSSSRAFTLDTVAPAGTAPFVSVIDNLGASTGKITAGGFSDDTTPTLSGTISAAISATDSVGISVNGTHRGNAVLAARTAGSSWSFSFETAGISLPANAPYTFTTRVLDAFGNEGTASAARFYNLLDSSAPSQTITISDVLDNVDLLTGSISAGGVTNAPPQPDRQPLRRPGPRRNAADPQRHQRPRQRQCGQRPDLVLHALHGPGRGQQHRLYPHCPDC